MTDRYALVHLCSLIIASLSVIWIAGPLPLPICLVGLGLVAIWLRRGFTVGLWAWLLFVVLIVFGVATTEDVATNDVLLIGPARLRNLLIQAPLAGIFVNAITVRPKDPRQTGLLIVIGLVLIACNVTNTFSFSGKVVSILLALCILAVLVVNHPRKQGYKSLVHLPAMGLVVTIFVFSFSSLFIISKQDMLYGFGNRLFDARPSSRAGGFDSLAQPTLTPLFGDPGNPTRVLSIQQVAPLYLRQASFRTYQAGAWFPTVQSRATAPLPTRYTDTNQQSSIQVHRYNTTDQVVYMPVSASQIASGTSSDLAWAPGEGGPIMSISQGDQNYSFVDTDVMSDMVCNNLFDRPDASYLDTPEELSGILDDTIEALSLTEGYTLETAANVIAALQSQHGYSLTFKPMNGDPLATFLSRSGSNAHCSYFASATTLILRRLGFPCRFVTGFLAHERVGNTLTVRAHDAHAWVEIWVPRRGWVTLEATPGGGIPHSTYDSLSLWTRISEAIFDLWTDLLVSFAASKTAVIAVLGGVLTLVISAWYLKKRRTRLRLTPTEQFRKEVEAHYLHIMQIFAVTPPVNQTLQAHFQQARDMISSFAAVELADILRQYDLSRYGEVDNMPAVLQQITTLKEDLGKKKR